MGGVGKCPKEACNKVWGVNLMLLTVSRNNNYPAVIWILRDTNPKNSFDFKTYKLRIVRWLEVSYRRCWYHYLTCSTSIYMISKIWKKTSRHCFVKIFYPFSLKLNCFTRFHLYGVSFVTCNFHAIIVKWPKFSMSLSDGLILDLSFFFVVANRKCEVVLRMVKFSRAFFSPLSFL